MQEINSGLVKNNYNQFTIHNIDIVLLLSSYPKTKNRVKDALFELMETAQDDSNSSRVVLDWHIWIKLSKSFDKDDWDTRFYIGMDDGLPSDYVIRYVNEFRDNNIRFKLNGHNIDVDGHDIK